MSIKRLATSCDDLLEAYGLFKENILFKVYIQR